MIELNKKEYVVIVQCHLVKQRCSGYGCEKALTERTGGFAAYSRERTLRHLNLTCGGCCGRTLHRKLSNLVTKIKKREGMTRDRIVVQLSSCITLESYHGPSCPHLDYIKSLIAKIGLDFMENTNISAKAEERRRKGEYECNTYN